MIDIIRNVPLADHANYRIGGPAAFFAEVASTRDLADAVRWAFGHKTPFLFIGAGTNMLFSDEGYPGFVIKNGIAGIEPAAEGVSAGSVVMMSEIVDHFVRGGMDGLAWAGGLPGTVGGAVYGNAGAFGGEMQDVVLSVESVVPDISRGTVYLHTRINAECGFGYRTSIFKEQGSEIITGVSLRMPPGDPVAITGKVRSCIEYRKMYQPIELPSAGSTFKNIPLDFAPEQARVVFADVVKTDPFPVIPAAAVLDRLGLKGMRVGGAEISSKHPNFFVNRDHATARDILALIALAKERARDQYGIQLEEEIRIIR